MGLHFKYSPSACDRWLSCNPSLGLSGHPSRYSAEGTVAHELADTCMLTGVEPSTHLGEAKWCDGFYIQIDYDMIHYVGIYLDKIRELELVHGDFELEKTIVHSKYPDFGGTIDCNFHEEEVVIVDLKYGAGVFVDVEENEQLGCYALLMLDSLGRPIQDVRAYVVQPRFSGASPIRSTVLTKEWLTNLMGRIEAVTRSPSDEKHSGSHCQFCPIRGTCDHLHKQALTIAQDEFAAVAKEFENALSEEESERILQQVSLILSKAGQIQGYVSAVFEWAHRHLGAGGHIEGWKLVEKFSNRRYKVSDEDVLKACRKGGFGKKQCTTVELKSPAQLEKVAGKKLVDALCHRVSTGTSLVPVSDKRDAVQKLSAADEFGHLEFEE